MVETKEKRRMKTVDPVMEIARQLEQININLTRIASSLENQPNVH